MKRIFRVLTVALVLFGAGCKDEVKASNVYVFSQPGCIHCEHAKEYMDRYYKNYDIKELNIHQDNNLNELRRYARKFKIKEALGTPMIVIGDNYIMGWGSEQQKDFNRLMKQFKPKAQN